MSSFQFQNKRDSSIEQLLQGLKQSIEPSELPYTSFFKQTSTSSNQANRDLPKLISPKPQRPINSFDQKQFSLKNSQNSSQAPNDENCGKQVSQGLPERKPFSQLHQSFSQNQSNTITINMTSHKQPSICEQKQVQPFQVLEGDSQRNNKIRINLLGDNNRECMDNSEETHHSSHTQSTAPQLMESQSSFAATKSSGIFTPFTKSTSHSSDAKPNFSELHQKLAAQLLMSGAFGPMNSIDFKVTNNNFYGALPDSIAKLVKQSQQNYPGGAAKKVLGKRKRKVNRQQSQEWSFFPKHEVSSEDNNSDNQSVPTQSENNIATQVQGKRKHVSSMSKAILAKKILSKIEGKPSQSTPMELPTLAPVQEEKKSASQKACNCKKSKCLKLYCECFANNSFCGPHCACNGCSNLHDHDEERLLAKEQILMRNPLAFRPKIETSLDENSLFNKDIKVDEINIQAQSEILLSSSASQSNFGLLAVGDKEKRHFKGCNCRKSGCLKKYCECYQQGVDCTGLCKCEGCLNCEGKKPSTFEVVFRIEKVDRTALQVKTIEEKSGKALHLMLQEEAMKNMKACLDEI